MIVKFLRGGAYIKNCPQIIPCLINLNIIFLTGCASVKITEVSENQVLSPNKLDRKGLVTISPFMSIPKHKNPKLDTKYLDQNTGFIYIGRKKDNPPKPTELGYKLAESLSKTLERKAKDIVVIEKAPPISGVWISGQMTQEIQGSRALRTLVGLGAGKTKLDTKTYVYNLDKSKKTPWLTIWTSGHSGYEPGAVFSAMPSPLPIFNILGAASTVGTIVNHSNKGLTQDAKRTGKELGETIGDHINKKRY